MHWLLLVVSLVPSSSELVRVIVVARHGNRAPNPQVPQVCPKVMPLAEQFHLPIHSKQRAALSDVGVCENWEAGNFLREEYKQELYGSQDKMYKDDGSFFAFSERMNRNVMSMEALLEGLWPEGTGEKQFLKSRRNLVPFLTSSPFHDTLINTPRDGPCKDRYRADTKAWDKANSETVMEKNKVLLEKFGKACGFDFLTSEETISKPFPWAIKAAADAFNMALNEGIDIGKDFDLDVVKETIAMASGVTNELRFGEKHKVTYWLGRFVKDALFANMEDPAGRNKQMLETVGQALKSKFPWQPSPDEEWRELKMLVFLNHRELMMSLSFLFGYESLLQTPLKAGSMIIYELHEEEGDKFIVTKAWNPTQPSFEAKHAALEAGTGLMDLYSHGTVETIKVGACDNQERCTLQQLGNAYTKWTEETGSWKELCGQEIQVEGEQNEQEDNDESYTAANDAATLALAHASEPSIVVATGFASISLLLGMTAFTIAIMVSFLGGIYCARRFLHRPQPDDYLAAQ